MKLCTPSSTHVVNRACRLCSLSLGKLWVAVSTRRCLSAWWASSTTMVHRSDFLCQCMLISGDRILSINVKTRQFFFSNPQDIYHKMIELSSEARRAYEVMVSNLEQTNQSEEMVNSEEELQFSSLAEKSVDAQPEEPEFSK